MKKREKRKKKDTTTEAWVMPGPSAAHAHTWRRLERKEKKEAAAAAAADFKYNVYTTKEREMREIYIYIERTGSTRREKGKTIGSSINFDIQPIVDGGCRVQSINALAPAD